MFNKKIKTIIMVEGMHCINCANRIKNSLLEIQDIKKVNIDLDNNLVTIISINKIDENIIKDTIEKMNYQYLGIKEI